MNILSCKGEYSILEQGSQTKSKLSRQGSSITQSISQSNGSGAVHSASTLKILLDKRGYCFSEQPQPNPQSSHYQRNIQVLLSLNRRRGWEWEEFCFPAHPSCHCLLFLYFLSTTATSHFWTSDRQLPKLDHLAFIIRHNHKAPRTWARWKVKFSSIHEQKHLHSKNLLFLGEVYHCLLAGQH